MIRVMLVDDQRLARLGFQLMLEDVPDITVTTQAKDGQEAIDLLLNADHRQSTLPDVILMDVRMPLMDGITATRQIARHWPGIQILILTTYDEDDYAFGGLDAGASGFLLKDVTKTQLTDAIHAIASGDATLTPRITKEILQRGLPNPINNSQQAELRASFDSLTPRQREICSLIAQGLSNKEISKQLVLEVSSVKRAISRILIKLNLQNRTQIAINWHKSSMQQE